MCIARGVCAVEKFVKGDRFKLVARFVKNADGGVDGLDEMVRADIAIGVGRPACSPMGKVKASKIDIGRCQAGNLRWFS